jgi:hypothetical protein
LKPNDESIIELVRPSPLARVSAALVPRAATPRPAPADVGEALEHGHLVSRRRPDQVLDADNAVALADAGFHIDRVTPFPPGPSARLPVRLPMGQTVLGLQLRLNADATPGSQGTIDLILRDTAGKPVGGLAIEIIATE